MPEPSSTSPYRVSEDRCSCVADDVRCHAKPQVGDTVCRSCRLHHTRPFGPNEPAQNDQEVPRG